MMIRLAVTDMSKSGIVHCRAFPRNYRLADRATESPPSYLISCPSSR